MGGFLTGYKVRGRYGEDLNITHFLFSDDTLVFCQDSTKQMIFFLRWILVWFEALPGLKINLGKSSIFSVGNVENVERLACELGCKVGELPTTYLGLLLGERGNTAKVWGGVEEKFRKKLAWWKSNYISKGDRLTLIKSTLSNIPTYLMSLFHFPRGVKFRLEKI